MVKFHISVCMLILLSALSACSDYKNIAYFHNINDSTKVYIKGEDVPVSDYQALTIHPDDLLQVTISTLDPSVDGMLNISSSTSTAATPNANAGSGVALPGPDQSGYLVSKEGDIEIPVLGTLHVGGHTTDEIKELVKSKAAVLYKSPVVNVRLINFKVTVLGEVTRPGTYVITGERANVLDAIGMAGDLTIYGKRENIMLVRQLPGSEKKIVRLDLNDTHMMASPWFYLQQGDVLYIEPAKSKAATTDAARTRNLTIAAAIISLVVVVISRINFK
ncbi:MAG: polysaccharide biosynthesis/export family protein [Arachidicoccus sp.]|nr:polysaccharide biosynthesis/export family protein [Arachidicoccus sp.]